MQTEELENILKKAGITATVREHDIFIAERSANGEELEIYLPRENEVSVKTENKQAVINIVEPKRVFDDRVYINGIGYVHSLKTHQGTAAQFVKKHNLRNLVDELRISAVDSTFSITGVKETEDKTGVYVQIKITAPEQHNCFLIGIDENHHFISQLKNPVKTVKQAHKELRPKGLKSGTFRIGEFFYEPVSKTKAKQLDKYRNICDSQNGVDASEKPPRKLELDYGTSLPFEDNENHAASCWARDGEEVYAIGFLVDDRGFHREKYIENWHRVVHNNEEINTSEAWD